LNTSLDLRTQILLSASQNNLIGKVLAKKYRIESYLSKGAMGWVYRGTDISLDIPIAIKILKPMIQFSERQEKCTAYTILQVTFYRAITRQKNSNRK